jgi:hypothetical protein
MARCTVSVASRGCLTRSALTLTALAACAIVAAGGPAWAQRLATGSAPSPSGSRTSPPVVTPAAGPAAGGVARGVILPPNIDAARRFYDGTALHDIHLTMRAEDWETLKENYQADTYYPADFQWRNVEVPRIGVRSRGAGGRSAVKPSLRVDFNRYVPDQAFLELKAMILANAVQDPAMLNRRLSMTVFAALELPAPRVVHARLFVNGEYVGLYEAVEAVEKAFLRRAFGWDSTGRHRRDEGYLFEYKWDDGYDWSYFGYDLGRYARLFEPKTHELDAPTVLYAPVDAMLRAINESSDADFEREVGKYLYLAVFIRHLAVERFISDVDGFLGDWGPNNFFIYRFEGRDLSAVIPWDKDSTFFNLHDDIYRGFERTVLGRRILAVPALRRAFLESLIDCASTVSQPAWPGSEMSWLEAEMLRERAQILEAAQADGNKPYSNERVDEAHQELLEFIRNRSAFVIDLARQELERLPQGAR